MWILKQFMTERSHSGVTFATEVLPPKVNLNEHIESVHEGKKPFKCNVCDAGLKRRSESSYDC